MRWLLRLVAGCMPLVLAAAAAGEVTFEATADRLRLSNGVVAVEFDPKDGAWTGLTHRAVEGNMIGREQLSAAVDFRADETWMVESLGSVLLRHAFERDGKSAAGTLSLTYGIGKRSPFNFIPDRWKDRAPEPMPVYAPPTPYEFELTVRYTLRPDAPRVDRRATLVRNVGKNFFRSSFRRVDGFLFVLPNVVVGRPADCTVNVPGPLYTYTYVEAGTPYEKLAGTYIDSKTTPDRLPGIVGIENRAAGLALATWMETGAEVAYQTYLSGDGRRLSAVFHTLRSDRMGDAGRIESDVQSILFAPDFPAAQAEHRSEQARSLPLSTTTPAWVREMVILEMMPALHGGFRGLADRLPFYRDIGFNTLYLMPHWVGGYGNADPRAVDPAFGTPEELAALVKRAHDLGMRVLFDMVIHGFAPGGAVAREHPGIFTRNEQGLVETHFNWGSLNTDPGNPDYVKFMEELVLHDLRTYGIDGYRVDANSFKSPNWDPASPRRPWQASSTLPLYRAMYAALQREKKDVVLYSEMFGPAWHSVSNLAQDANWAVVTDLFARFDRGEANAATYKAGMLQLQESLQPGVNRIRFCRNHDTCWFFPDHWRGYTPRFLALDGIHILTGVPVVFAGDRDHPPSLEDDANAVGHYRKLIAVRKEFPEFARGELLLREIAGDDPWVFTALRRDGDAVGLLVGSLAPEASNVRLRLDLPGRTLEGVELVDPVSGEKVAVRDGGVTVKPFQTLVGRLRRPGG